MVPGSGSDDTAALQRQALESLAQTYWRPIHAWLCRAWRLTDDDARELAQDFFVWVMETGFLARADPTRGRFRAFLKTALRHYATDRERGRAASKRGGDRRFVPLVGEGTDSVAYPLASSERSADQVLDDAWRQEVVQRALQATQDDLEASGRGVVFAVFRAYFLDAADDDAIDYRALAACHGITTVDVSNFLQRAKRAYRAQLRLLLQETVSNAVDLDAELAWLVGGGGE